MITFPGTGGVPRHVTVNYSSLGSVLWSVQQGPSEPWQTTACLFPQISGSLTTQYPAYVVSSIVLPDNSQYSFLYDSYGEVSKMTLPTGGAYTYKYLEATGCSDAAGNSGVLPLTGQPLTIYRRLQERDELSDGVNVSSKAIFTATPVSATDPNHPSRKGTMVQVYFEDGMNNLLRQEIHYFYGDPSSQASMPANPVAYPVWSDGLEFQSQAGNGSSVLLTQQKVWTQRGCVTTGLDNNCWNPTPATDGDPPHDPQVCQTNTTLDSGQPSGQVFAYDEFNNITSSYGFDYGAAPAVGANCPTTPTGYLLLTQTAYQYQSSATYASANLATTGASGLFNLVGLPASRTIYSGAGIQMALDQWIYDQSLTNTPGIASHDDTLFPYTTTIRGNVNSHQVWQNTTGTYPAEAFNYDTTGSLLNYFDFNNNETQFTYTDTAHVNPNTMANPLGMNTGLTYEPNTLKPTSIADQNGIAGNYSTTYSYVGDPLDRLTIMTRGAGTSAASSTSYTYTTPAPTSPSPVTVTTRQDQTSINDGLIAADVIYDLLGRPFQTDQYEASSQITTTVTYDALSRVQKTFNPARPGYTLYYTTNTWDALGRLTTVQTPDNAATTTAYTGGSVSSPREQIRVTDPAGSVHLSTTDALGRITQVIEDPAVKNYSTTYQYDALNNLTAVSQGAETRSFSYDSRSRQLSAANPEQTSPRTWSYDNNGNVVYRQDSRGVGTCYTYDPMNRTKLQVYFTGGSSATSCVPASNNTATPSVSYTYDAGVGITVANAMGRLTAIASSAATEQITGYSALGRITGSTQTIAGQTYNFNYTWNLADALLSTTYPTTRVVTNTYDVANRVTAVTGTLNGTPTYYLSGMSYAAQGAPAAYTYGNQLARAYKYNNRLQPYEMTDSSTASTNPLLDLQFFFGGSTTLNGNSTANNGNVTQIVINTSQQSAPVTSFTQTYAYDTVNRITSASDTGPWTQTFNYDQFGNMWSPSYSGLPSQPLMPSLQSAYAAATNQLAVGASYDAAGNQPVFASSNLVYDAENRQLTATNNSGSGAVVTYAYDGLGERVSKSSSATGITTIYVHDAFGNLAVEYNPPATSLCTTCYLSWDHLGSTRMVTDASAIPVTAPKARHDYVPFGVEIPAGYAGRTASWGVSDGLTPKFTGQDRDTDTGLDFFQARYMGTAQGRFTSPDPAGNSVGNPSNPQSWNLYSYVFNNPLALVDPSGTDACASLSDPGCDDSGLIDVNVGWWGPDQSLPPPPYLPPPATPVPNPTTGPYGNQGGASTPCGAQGGGVQGNSAFGDNPTGCPVHPPLLTIGPRLSTPSLPKITSLPSNRTSGPQEASLPSLLVPFPKDGQYSTWVTCEYVNTEADIITNPDAWILSGGIAVTSAVRGAWTFGGWLPPWVRGVAAAAVVEARMKVIRGACHGAVYGR